MRLASERHDKVFEHVVGNESCQQETLDLHIDYISLKQDNESLRHDLKKYKEALEAIVIEIRNAMSYDYQCHSLWNIARKALENGE